MIFKGFMTPSPAKVQAFSLVELSIVLVILGLLVGGVLSGQSLIRAAEIRSVMTDYSRFATASQTFRDKYFAMPGDMPNATKFWSATTSDGNGNGIMDPSAAPSAAGEMFMAWQHLARAGLIEGSYTGIAGTVSLSDPNLGINVPASKISNAGWNYGSVDNSTAGSPYVFNYNMRNWLLLGSEDDNIWLDGPILKDEEAWNIDIKMDDGKPAMGRVMAAGLTLGCTGSVATPTTNTNRDATYNFMNTAKMCAMVFNPF
jgi:prepilin-type N-terminal cleavage/methylation domain-containing protein